MLGGLSGTYRAVAALCRERQPGKRGHRQARHKFRRIDRKFVSLA
jgi:hypothetical protein